MRAGGAEPLPGWAGLGAAGGFTRSSSRLFQGSHHTLQHVTSPPEPPSSLAACPPAILPPCLCFWLRTAVRASLGEARVPLSDAPLSEQG